MVPLGDIRAARDTGNLHIAQADAREDTLSLVLYFALGPADYRKLDLRRDLSERRVLGRVLCHSESEENS